MQKPLQHAEFFTPVSDKALLGEVSPGRSPVGSDAVKPDTACDVPAQAEVGLRKQQSPYQRCCLSNKDHSTHSKNFRNYSPLWQ